ncbi:adenosylcobinamide-phosphate synthase [Pseudobutyrivibrio xylanivorans]|uniref:Cobalamin biosynthesis protein CobD n=2 Tax=Pseudobutyrivibrio xylanivorans TaxID=185007 RepID=A0A1G5S0T5_PSEXY|nr:adenosylcobinamide-phosphate synthase [Pseudobutyrivibrio xylanivorans]
MIYHMTAFLAGFILDLFVGDPIGFPHPVRWIGSLISNLTDLFLSNAERTLEPEKINKRKRRLGLIMVIIVITVSAGICFSIVHIAYTLNSILGVIVESVITYQCIATKSLYTESMKVQKALKSDGLDAGRKAVSMIVGRDTACLDEKGVIKAAVETVAENTSDGIIAPLIYLAIGGPVLGIAYKAINTMDSMVGYKNDKYMDFGRAAAKLDDVVNFIPARISAVLMIISCIFLGKDYSFSGACRIFKRDRFNHSSPNSAQTESVCAGALGVRLAGPASYFGKIVDKKFIGDPVRSIELDDIKRANILMLVTAIICEVLLICTVVIFTGIAYSMISQ